MPDAIIDWLPMILQKWKWQFSAHIDSPDLLQIYYRFSIVNNFQSLSTNFTLIVPHHTITSSAFIARRRVSPFVFKLNFGLHHAAFNYLDTFFVDLFHINILIGP